MRILTFLNGLFVLLIPELVAQDRFKEALDEFQIRHAQEKVYLHFDKPYYGIGEEIWFKAYVVDGTLHKPLWTKSALYIDLISEDKEIVKSLMIPINEGIANGNFLLTPNLNPGKYRIRAYTNWMKNLDQEFFFIKDILVISPEQETDKQVVTSTSTQPNFYIDFMPEGGDLVDGISTKVAIKTTDSLGLGVRVTGKIEDENGNEITSFESNHLGHSLAFLNPSFGSSYFAVIDGTKYQLPTVKNQGAIIRIIHSPNSNDLNIAVLSNGIDLKDGMLVAHQRGKHLFTLKSSSADNFAVRLEKSKIGFGICHFTFFSKEYLPLSERLLFTNIPTETTDFQIKSDKKSYKERERVVLSLASPNQEIHSASITINPKEEIIYPADGENIVNYLLLSSDLKGRIQHPNYYFKQTAQAYRDLDLLMLTQGWVRFAWESLLDGETYVPKYIQENGITIRGQLVDYFDKSKVRKGYFNFTVPATGVLDIEGETDDNGYFYVGGNEFYDSTLIMINAHRLRKNKEKKIKNVSINLIDEPTPNVISSEFPVGRVTDRYKLKVDKLAQIARAYNLDSSAIMLNEVTVTSIKSKADRYNDRTRLYSRPTNRLIVDSLNYGLGGAVTVLDLLAPIPGVVVAGRSVRVRGNVPRFLLDGIPIDREIALNLPYPLIEFIDVLRGPDAIIYGQRSVGGIIAIYTRQGPGRLIKEEARGLIAFKHPGYSKTKQFYSPKYDVPREAHAIPDFRSTLFWEPNLSFLDGKEVVEFYTSDQPGAYSIRIEGLTKEGNPIFSEGEILIR